jgi:hypothetical protein
MSELSDREHEAHNRWREESPEILGEERARIEHQHQQDAALVQLEVACRVCLTVRSEPSDLISKQHTFSANASFIFTCTSDKCRGVKRPFWILRQPCGTPIAVNLAKLKPVSGDVIEAPQRHRSPWAKD